MSIFFLIILIFLIIWQQYPSALTLPKPNLKLWQRKRDITLRYPTGCTISPTERDWEQKIENFTSFSQLSQTGDPERARKYLEGYNKAYCMRHHMSSLCSKPKNLTAPKILQNEFITNPVGEYSLNFALDNGLRRVEVGTFEKSANGTIFVVRGILYRYGAESLSLYHVNNTGLFETNLIFFKSNYYDPAAKAILCACCAQHSTCSKMCDKSIAVNENCAPNVGPDEKLPRIKEQWFKATKNGSYEMRVFFENNFFEHAEVAEVNNMVGFFLDPEKTQEDLPYYYSGSIFGIDVGLVNFPYLIPCLTLAKGFMPLDYSEIDMQLLRSFVG